MLTAGKSTEVGSSADLNPGMGGRGGGGKYSLTPSGIHFAHFGMVFKGTT